MRVRLSSDRTLERPRPGREAPTRARRPPSRRAVSAGAGRLSRCARLRALDEWSRARVDVLSLRIFPSAGSWRATSHGPFCRRFENTLQMLSCRSRSSFMKREGRERDATCELGVRFFPAAQRQGTTSRQSKYRRLRAQSIADAANRLDNFGSELLAQRIHVDVDEVRRRVERVTPNV